VDTPSTKFYLRTVRRQTVDHQAPVSVHVVEKLPSRTNGGRPPFKYLLHHTATSTASNGSPGFRRVEQLDSESYGEFVSGNSAAPIHRRQDALSAAGQDRHLVSHRRFSRQRAHSSRNLNTSISPTGLRPEPDKQKRSSSFEGIDCRNRTWMLKLSAKSGAKPCGPQEHDARQEVLS